jgi:hypothetical protein
MRTLGQVGLVLISCLTIGACDDSGLDGPCGSGGTCGFHDHRYDSTFYCPPGPLRPGGWHGYSWRDEDRCRQECAAAASWGCDASGCDAGCATDHGTGAWQPCTEAYGGTPSGSVCFLSGSGVNGETVPCACR